jgi:hypothetical protein
LKTPSDDKPVVISDRRDALPFAFELIPNTYALLDGCETKCALRRGMIGEVRGKLYVDTGVHARLLTRSNEDRYKDDLGREWTTFRLIQ